MQDYLIIDIGSTYTKQRLFAGHTLVASAQTPTTITDVYKGIKAGQDLLKTQVPSMEPKQVLASSSAAGGLRMVAMGYMARVTAKAAKEVAMSSGSKILEILSSEDEPDYKVDILQEIRPDIVLLAGGTDFGDETSIIENAHVIVNSGVSTTVIVAGNVAAQGKVARILKDGAVSHIRIPNIMPTIHRLEVKQARETIHKEFIKQITKARGLDRLVTQITNDQIIPTPGAVLMAAEILAHGTDFQKGIGELIVVDLGGATTDVHSVIPAYADLPDEEIGLVVGNDRQVAQRSVEGNLGMRVSATGVVNTVSPQLILHKLGIHDEDMAQRLMDYAYGMEEDPTRLPVNDEEYQFDTLLAKTAVEVALKRHAGTIALEPDPITGVSAGMPTGRDLRNVSTIIAVGGIFAHRSQEESEQMIKDALADKGISLLPRSFRVLVDKRYLLYTAGIIGTYDKEYAFEILRRDFNLPKKNREDSYDC